MYNINKSELPVYREQVLCFSKDFSKILLAEVYDETSDDKVIFVKAFWFGHDIEKENIMANRKCHPITDFPYWIDIRGLAFSVARKNKNKHIKEILERSQILDI